MELLRHLGPVLLGGVFVWAGLQHFLNFSAMADMMRRRRLPFPAVLLATGSAWEALAGLCLALGVGRPWAAATLIVFTCVASVLLLDFWHHEGPERQGMQAAFTNNVAIIGGLLLAGWA
jgi:putative oxidoreductase